LNSQVQGLTLQTEKEPSALPCTVTNRSQFWTGYSLERPFPARTRE